MLAFLPGDVDQLRISHGKGGSSPLYPCLNSRDIFVLHFLNVSPYYPAGSRSEIVINKEGDALQLNFFNNPPMPPRRPLRAVSGNIVKREELTPFLRGKILDRHEVGESAHTISQALGIPRRTVRDTIDKKDIRSEGRSKERSGQPRKFTQRAIRRIFRIIKEEPFITYRQLRDKLDLGCSPSTILRALKDSKWGHWRAAKRPRLTAEHARLRFEFANRYED